MGAVRVPQDDAGLVNRSAKFLLVAGRLRRGASPEQARAELATIADRLEEPHPGENANLTVRTGPGRQRQRLLGRRDEPFDVRQVMEIVPRVRAHQMRDRLHASFCVGSMKRGLRPRVDGAVGGDDTLSASCARRMANVTVSTRASSPDRERFAWGRANLERARPQEEAA